MLTKSILPATSGKILPRSAAVRAPKRRSALKRRPSQPAGIRKAVRPVLPPRRSWKPVGPSALPGDVVFRQAVPSLLYSSELAVNKVSGYVSYTLPALADTFFAPCRIPMAGRECGSFRVTYQGTLIVTTWEDDNPRREGEFFMVHELPGQPVDSRFQCHAPSIDHLFLACEPPKDGDNGVKVAIFVFPRQMDTQDALNSKLVFRAFAEQKRQEAILPKQEEEDDEDDELLEETEEEDDE